MSRPYFPSFDDNDTVKVGQQNELVDNDMNLNDGSLFQKGLFNVTDVDQDIDSGENEQSNDSQIFDGPAGYGFGADDNDFFKVGQSNLMDDSDYNINDASLFQAGVFNVASVDEQDIDSGENEQSNYSLIDDHDAGGGWKSKFGFGADGNDTVKVDQSNFMIDTDQNANVFEGAQLGFANITGVDQEIDSGENEQANTSLIGDYGVAGFGYDDNDAFHVSQASLMADADENVNGVETGQFGALNLGHFDQDITSGGNSQSNFSEIWDG
jgi:hypothetical protein